MRMRSCSSRLGLGKVTWAFPLFAFLSEATQSPSTAKLQGLKGPPSPCKPTDSDANLASFLLLLFRCGKAPLKDVRDSRTSWTPSGSCQRCKAFRTCCRQSWKRSVTNRTTPGIWGCERACGKYGPSFESIAHVKAYSGHITLSGWYFWFWLPPDSLRSCTVVHLRYPVGTQWFIPLWVPRQQSWRPQSPSQRPRLLIKECMLFNTPPSGQQSLTDGSGQQMQQSTLLNNQGHARHTPQWLTNMHWM